MRQPHKGAGGCHIPHSGLRLQARGSQPRACVAEETWGRASPGQLRGFPVTNNCVTFLSVPKWKSLAGRIPTTSPALGSQDLGFRSGFAQTGNTSLSRASVSRIRLGSLSSRSYTDLTPSGSAQMGAGMVAVTMSHPPHPQ